MIAFLKQQKITLAVLASFGLAVAGLSMLGDSGAASSNAKVTITSKVASKSSRGTNSIEEEKLPTVSRRAPSTSKNLISGQFPAKTKRALTNNNGGKPHPGKIQETLRDAHLAAVEERAKEAKENQEKALAAAPEVKEEGKKEGAAAAASTKPGAPRTITEAVAATSTPADQKGDYRRRLLRQAVLEVLNSEEPWKELIAIALVQSEIKDLKGAKETLDLAKRLVPHNSQNPNARAASMVSIAQAQCRIGQLDPALDTAVSIANERYQNQAISTIISEYINRLDFSAAKTLVSSLSLADFREASLRNIAEGEARVGKVNPAISTVSLISNMDMRNDALKRVAVTQARAKQWDGAISTASLISDVEVSQLTHADIIRLRIDAGDLNAAQLAITTIQKDSIRDDLYGRLSRKLASQGNINYGLRAADHIKNEISKENTLASVVVQQARLGETLAAFSKANNLLNVGPQTQGVRDVTLVEAKLRGTSAAFNMATLIENPESRDATLRAIAQREAGMGNLTSAVNCAHSINATDCRVLALAETALSCIKNAPSRQAVSILEDTTQLIPTIPENSGKRSEAIIKIASAYALINRMDETIGNLIHISSNNRRDGALEQIAYDCVGKNRLEDAQNLASRIIDPARRKRTLESLALRHAKNVEPARVNEEVNRFNTKEQRGQFLRGMAARND